LIPRLIDEQHVGTDIRLDPFNVDARGMPDEDPPKKTSTCKRTSPLSQRERGTGGRAAKNEPEQNP